MEELQEVEENKKNPLIYVLAIFLIFLIVLMAVPYYGIKADPSPKNIPSLDEVLIDFNEYNVSSYRINSFQEVNIGISPLVRNVAARVSSSCSESSKVCYSKAIFYFVRDNIRYVNDPEREYIQNPDETLKIARSGDCEDINLAMAYLLKAVNIRVRMVLTSDHSFVQAYLEEAKDRYKTNGDWISLDGTCKSCEFSEIDSAYLKTEQSFIYLN